METDKASFLIEWLISPKDYSCLKSSMLAPMEMNFCLYSSLKERIIVVSTTLYIMTTRELFTLLMDALMQIANLATT